MPPLTHALAANSPQKCVYDKPSSRGLSSEFGPIAHGKRPQEEERIRREYSRSSVETAQERRGVMQALRVHAPRYSWTRFSSF
jgi:hypothetical protein